METRLSRTQQWALVVLRIVIGWHLLYEGIVKLLMPDSTSAAYLELSRWIFQGFFQRIANTPTVLQIVDLVRQNGILAGIGAHKIETIRACMEAGFEPDFWMKTFHHRNYWSAKHPIWYDNLYCESAEETAAYMATVKQPWIAFKTMAAGAIHPREAFRFAFESGADFVCAGMYDFQMVEDVNITLDILGGDLDRKRPRPWRA